VGDSPLALARGITPEIVADYLDVADCFLVSTGIGRGFTQLQPDMVRRLIEPVRPYGGSVR
jgi:hypothetical protein